MGCVEQYLLNLRSDQVLSFSQALMRSSGCMSPRGVYMNAQLLCYSMT